MKTARHQQAIPLPPRPHLAALLPEELRIIENPQTAIPAIAKDSRLGSLIANLVMQVPTEHTVLVGDARDLDLPSESIHLIVTSPPYWTVKKYRDSDGQLGDVQDYEQFLAELDRVWEKCFNSLVTGGRLICVVGDVCLSRKMNSGRHTVVPLHASIQEHCRRLGFDNLAPIIWHKISKIVTALRGRFAWKSLIFPFSRNFVTRPTLAGTKSLLASLSLRSFTTGRRF